jgi:hypothetical protein
MRVIGWSILLAGCPFPSEPRECAQIEEELAAEQLLVQACSVDADCGQVLTGTSCGCTRDLVANVTADVSLFEELWAEGQAEECDVGGTSVCDCPEAAGFRCDDGTCAWNYVSDWPYLPSCSADLGDPYDLTNVVLEGSELVATVGYGGGCEEHVFTLCWPDQSFMESYPVQAGLDLYHEGNDDPCDAYFVEDVRFSLVPLSDAYTDAYGGTSATIVLHLGEFELPWTFGP